MKKNEMGGACSMYGAEECCIQGFGGERGLLENLGVGGEIILILNSEIWDGEHGLDLSGSG